MHRRLAPAAVLVVLALAACTPAPATNDASQEWAEAVTAGEGQGGGGGVLGLQTIGGADEATAALRLQLEPFAFTRYSAGCHHGGPVKLVVSGFTGDAIATSMGVDLECDGSVHEYTLPGGGGAEVDRVDFSATADEAVSVAILLPAPDPAVSEGDVWADHFTERAAGFESPSGVSWGRFGPEGQVTPVGLTAGSVPPGDHVVTVECGAAATFPVDVVFRQGESLPETAEAHELSCPGSATYPFTTDEEGLSVELDSRGEPGAYLIAIDALP